MDKPKIPNHRLRDARRRRGWSLKEVADLIDLPDSRTVGRWERGESFPRPRYRRELGRIFEKSLEELGLLREKIDSVSQGTEYVPDKPETTPIWKIPTSFTLFLGRDQEIASIAKFLRRPEVRLLTILGTGGVGKTRLAVEAARKMQDDFPAGICFVSLAAIHDSALVISTIAKELHIRDNQERTLIENLYVFLKEKQFLLMIDNFEHVLEAGDFIENLLANCPNLKILVTSRAVLHLQAEHEFFLDPLPLPERHVVADECLAYDCIQLFIRRAQARLPTFQIKQDMIPTLREICVALDGLPLAIELAAARIKMFPLQSLLTEISQQRLHILKSEQRTLPPRQTTLLNTVQWSYDLLNEQEQWLFRHLAVFPGGCTPKAAEMICRLSPYQSFNILDVLTSLHDKSLIQQNRLNGELPFFTLLKTIREYGINALQKCSEWETTRQAHAQYYLTLLEEAEIHLKGVQQGVWLARLDDERENLLAALTYLIEQQQIEQALRFCDIFGKFCGLRGYWSEERYWLEATLKLSEAAPCATTILGRVLRRAGHLAYRSRELAKAQELLERSVVLSRSLNDQQNLAGALSGLGWVMYRRNDLATSRQLLQESVEVARYSKDKWVLANALEGLGRFLHDQGLVNEAYPVLLESVALARVVEDAESLARILSTYANLEITQGNVEQAALSAQESYSLAQALGNKPLIALVLGRLADIAFFQQDYAQSAELYERRIQIANELDDRSTIALMRLRLGDIALMQGNLDQGTKLAQASLIFFQSKQDNPNVAIALCLLSDIRRGQKEFRKAFGLYREALLVEKELREHKNVARCLVGMALVMLELGLSEQAIWLLAFVENWQSSDRSNTSMHFSWTENYKLACKSARTQVDQDAFTTAWATGGHMVFEDLVNVCVLPMA